MPIEFRCDHCDRLLRTPDETAGKQAKCPECGAILGVPTPEIGLPGPPPPSPHAGSPFGPGVPPVGQTDVENPYQSPQQAYGHPPFVPRYVPNYLVQAILCTLFCCLPFGIVAIIFAAQVNGHLAARNYQAAVSASQNARTWCWVSFWLGLIPIILWFMFVLAGALAGIVVP